MTVKVTATRSVKVDVRGGSGEHVATLADLRALMQRAEGEALPDSARLSASVSADDTPAGHLAYGPVRIMWLEADQ